MAGAVAGGGALLSASLKVLLNRMDSPEVRTFLRGQKLSATLRRELKMKLLAVKAVLNDAEAKQITNSDVKDWMDELKDAVYDAEDLVDDITTEALRCKMESDSQSQVRNIIFGEGIESRVEGITDTLEYLAQKKDVLGLKEGVGENLSKRWPTTSLVDESGVYGRDADKEKIVESLLFHNASGNKIGVIALVGMGGIGKTTLTQLVYNDRRVVEYFDLKAWVCVSDEFDLVRITKTILMAFDSGTSGKSPDDDDLNLLQLKLKERLSRKKFLLVLDDVWNEDYNIWDLLRTPFSVGLNGSKIIVTTRIKKVAAVMHSAPIHPLGQLSFEDCWSLFAKHAFENGDSSSHPKLEEIGKEIITDLPDSIGNLTHLRYLDLTYTPIKRLPESVCNLYNLQTLILYYCERKQSGTRVGELRELSHIGGSLVIQELQNVVDAKDASEANLVGKQRLDELELEWNRDSDVEQNGAYIVLNNLQPHSNLRRLTIHRYGGSKFPDWLGGPSILNMVSLRLWNCKNVSTFPPLGQLPSLKHLYILGLGEIERVGAEFYGTEPSFVSLKALSFQDMPVWKEWLCLGGQGGEFPRLKELYIKNCPKLTGDLPNHLPLLTKLEIEECEQLVAPLPRVPAIRVLTTRSCDISQWKELPPLLRSLSITNSDSAESLLEEGMLQSNACLEDLSIINCGTCNSLSFNIPHGKFPRLARIQIWGLEGLESLSISISGGDLTTFASLNIGRCPNLVSIELPALNISRYSIFNCENLKSLLHNAACFQSLVLEDCPELIFPIQGLPSNLTSLFIRNCDKLTSQVEWGLQGLPSLTSLTISGLPNLMSLDGMGLQLLTSLRKLQICDGPKLQSLTEERLPSSLSFLTIRDCPLLKDRCKFWTGEDWHLIAHIPHIVIDDQVL
uniref:Disease resistance RPP13-like protein 1 n=1 Tax=Vitis vinifera TaxID=29760 RepID=F6H954_VITVI